MSKEAYYFSHDDNARNDIKIRAMRKRYGVAGYGRYWILIEMLRSEEDHKLPHRDFTYIALADEFDCDEQEARKFIDDLINTFDLLVSDDEYFWSESLIRRMEKRDEIKQKRRDAAKTRWSKTSKSNANAMQNNANAEQNDPKERKGKEKKGKERKRKESESEVKEISRPHEAEKELIEPVGAEIDPSKKIAAKKVSAAQEFERLAQSAKYEEERHLEGLRDEDLEVLADQPQSWLEAVKVCVAHFETEFGKKELASMCRSVGVEPEKVNIEQVLTAFFGKNKNQIHVWKNPLHYTASLGGWIKTQYTKKPRRYGSNAEKPNALKVIKPEKFAKYEQQWRESRATGA